MDALRHDAHYLDRDNLARGAKRLLGRPDNRRLFELCGSADIREIDLACKFMLRAFGPALRKAGERWEELSLSWPVPRGAHVALAARLVAFVRPLLAGGGAAFRTASLPLGEDLDVLTLSFVRIA